MRTPLRTALAISLAALAACGTVTHSSYLETGGFYVVYAVVRELDGTLRAVSVFKDRGDNGLALDLDDGDAVTIDGLTPGKVSNGGSEAGFSSSLVVSYEADVDAGVAHQFTLTRTGEDPITKEVDDPPVFAPVFSDGGTNLTAGVADTVTLTWTAQSGATVTITNTVTSGSACASSTLVTGLSDTGTVSIAGTAISTDGGACAMTFTLVRTDDTTIGTPFHGGALRTVAVAETAVTLQ